ncbi:hypothetical protein Tco_0685851 [Tanacetum coccineum]
MLYVAANLSEIELKKILIDKMEANNSINRSDIQKQLYQALVDAYEADKILLDTYGDTERGVQQEEGQDKEPESYQCSKRTNNHEAGKTTTDVFEAPAHQEFEIGIHDEQAEEEILIIPPPNDCPTFELMKGTCKSLTELEYFCEEVYKATIEKLDWINPEGRQYPNDLRQPLPLVPNYQDYGHIKWIEDLVPNSMWSQMIVKYDKFDLWGISHWGKKRRQFYAFAITRETARDVYSKRRIIAVKGSEIRLPKTLNPSIEDMLLLLAQGKRIHLEKLKTRRTDLDGNCTKLHQFSNGYSRMMFGCLNDRLKGIRMEYLPQTFWSQRDKANARAMIQAIDKRLKTKRIMRSLEIFVGGRPYGGDLRLLQRTI